MRAPALSFRAHVKTRLLSTTVPLAMRDAAASFSAVVGLSAESTSLSSKQLRDSRNGAKGPSVRFGTARQRVFLASMLSLSRTTAYTVGRVFGFTGSKRTLGHFRGALRLDTA